MKRIFFYALLLALVVIGSAPYVGAEDAPDFKAMLKTVDGLVSFMDTDFSAEYAIVLDKPGESRSVTDAVMFRRDKDEKYLILILEPTSDKGKGYLKIGQSLWLYDPLSRRFTFTSSKERFQNSNARNSDFTRSNFAGDYDIVSGHREALGRFNCWVIDLKANNDGVSFPKTKIWVSDDNLVRKTEDYSLSGQLMRTTAIPTYQKVGNRFLPVTMLIVDNLRGKTINGKLENERTQITITKPSLSTLPDSIFTQAYLEKVSK
jgi:outer membrane lipoprotein-sorting protein